jgi:putative membrane protein insertion efficiency factor
MPRRRSMDQALRGSNLMKRQDRAGVVSLALKVAVRAYQLVVSPLLPPACRFLPSCSEYAVEAIERHGAFRGSALTLRRVARCHPWGGSGYDPVPQPGALDRLGADSGH